MLGRAKFHTHARFVFPAQYFTPIARPRARGRATRARRWGLDHTTSEPVWRPGRHAGKQRSAPIPVSRPVSVLALDRLVFGRAAGAARDCRPPTIPEIRPVQSDRLLCDARRPRHPLIPSCNTVRLQNGRIQTRARQPVLHSHSYHGIYLLSGPHAHRSRAVRVRNGIRRSSESAPCAAARHPCDLARTPSAPRSGPSSPAAAAAARRIICSWRRGA